MAYRINPKGGIIPVHINSKDRNSSFKAGWITRFLLKSNQIRYIRLNDGSRIAVREESLMVDTEEPYNEKATKLLHDQSNQLTAVVHGPVIVINPEDFNT